ncbi:MAG: hypothetical protein HKN44_05540 [Ilumatobacter sp.]|nr:hypothetical protein [Ilumatobacter sp.]
MAAPKFSPVEPNQPTRTYASPDHVPPAWMPVRPADIVGFQPVGPQLGRPGPDQGYALRLANKLVPSLVLQEGEHPDDVVRGCLGIALRRASLFSRAPVVHDLRLAFTMWGFYDDRPEADLLETRSELFAGLRHVGHHYAEARRIADMAPELTLRMAPEDVAAAYARSWRAVVGL